MVASSPPLLESREKYERNKNSLIDVIRDKEHSFRPNSAKPTRDNKDNTIDSGKEWLDKLNSDIEVINKEQNMRPSHHAKKDIRNNSSMNTMDYTGIIYI